jgi:hypothetical protein
MARRSLKPQLNQIRSWVRQGRTDAWIAHQLEVPVREVDGFKREHDLMPGGSDAEPEGDAPRHDEDIDLRAEDDALVAAELDAEPVAVAPVEEAAEDDDRAARRRRRGRRGGRTRQRGEERTGPLEGTFDHGEEGYGLWLDPAVQDDPVYAEHWAGHRPVTVSVEPDQIVIRRLGEEPEAGDDAGSSMDAEAPVAAPRPRATRKADAGVASPAVPVGAGPSADPDAVEPERLAAADPSVPVAVAEPAGADEPPAAEPVAAADSAVPDEAPAADQPVVDEPVTTDEVPVADEPAAAEQAPAGDEPVADEPVAAEPVAGEPVTAEEAAPAPKPRRRSRARKPKVAEPDPAPKPGTTLDADDFDA